MYGNVQGNNQALSQGGSATDRQSNYISIVQEMEGTNLENKTLWSMADFCAYTGFKQSYAYKLTHERAIPYYKPKGGKIFFKSEEIISWLTTNPVMSVEQITITASAYNFSH